MKKIFFPGLIASIVILLLGMIISIALNYLLPGMKAAYENTSVFRAWSDPLMSLYFLYPFLIGFLLAWVWNKIKKVVKGKSVWKRGFKFATTIWLLSSVPGLVLTFSSFQIGIDITLVWLAIALIQLNCAGLIYAKMNK
jgi:hypothetical protein